MALREFILDTWAPFSHKSPLETGRDPVGMAPTWVGSSHRRRLLAYLISQAYIDNVARHFLATDSDTVKKAHREYGDAALLVDAVRAAIIGSNPQIVVDEAAEDAMVDPAGEDVSADDPGRAGAPEPSDDDPGADVADDAAATRQDDLRQWALDERFLLKMIETENRAVGLGDGVYVLRTSAKKKRVMLRVYDPDCYFPVLSDDDDEEFPERVHLAWEFERDDVDGQTRQYVRRTTYELVPLVDEAGNPQSRRHKYQAAGDEPATTTCLLTNAVWRFEGLAGRSVDDLDMSKATFETITAPDGSEVVLDRYDLGIDFMPVVHVPNTPATTEHFGRSVLARVAQILDDVAAADTDLAKAAATTGVPPLAQKSAGPGTTSKLTHYGPGTVIDGDVTVVDTSNSLTALIEYVKQLLDRMSTNARVPAEVLGRVKASEVPSGIALMLAFGPFRALVEELRLVRDEKYRLLFRFVQRLMIEAGWWTGPVFDAGVSFGSFLPSDQKAAVDMIVALLGSHAISRQTALAMLVEAGVNIESIADELRRIMGEDFESAALLLDLTDDLELVYNRIGLDPALIERVPVAAPPPPPPAPGETPPGEPPPIPPVAPAGGGGPGGNPAA